MFITMEPSRHAMSPATKFCHFFCRHFSHAQAREQVGSCEVLSFHLLTINQVPRLLVTCQHSVVLFRKDRKEIWTCLAMN